MALDGYSYCPGGSGKRIKFCCPDLLPQLQQIDRMLEGQQHHACLEYVEKLEQEKPDRACLLAIKTQLLRAVDREDELDATVARFREKHPANPVALAEAAIVAAEKEGGRAGVDLLQQAMEACVEQIPTRMYEAIGAVAEAMLDDGQVLAARALLLLQSSVRRDDPHPIETVIQMNAAPNVPPLLKDDPTLKSCPAGFPRKEEFQRAMEPVGRGCWRQSAERLAVLAESQPGCPEVWRNLATLRSWVGDTTGSREALERLAALEVPLEDAVEAVALSRLMSDDPLGDEVDVMSRMYPLDDLEAVQTALASSPQAVAVSVDPARLVEEGKPPPKAAFFLLDRPDPEDFATASADGVARAVVQVLLFGRETDRQPRLELPVVSARRLDVVHGVLDPLVPETSRAGATSRVIGHVSTSRELLRPDWHLSNRLAPDEVLDLLGRIREDVLMNQWPQLPLKLLDGKSPREASADPAQHIKLLAAILVLEFWNEERGGAFDFNRLRSALGLPALGPIDPQQTPIEELPLGRLARLEVEKLSDDALLHSYRRALAFRIGGALEKLARELLVRPKLGGQEELVTACRLLAEREEDTGRALEYIARGRQASRAGASCAVWDFMEVSLRLERNEFEEFARLVEHLQSQHMREPGVAAALTRLLVQIGAIHPDGSPAMPAPAEQPSIVVPGAAGAEPGKLWTPGGPQEGGRGQKLWTPE